MGFDVQSCASVIKNRFGPYFSVHEGMGDFINAGWMSF